MQGDPRLLYLRQRLRRRGGAIDALAAFRDASSGKACPLTLANWALCTSKVPSHTWGFQDASGNIAASVGTLLTTTGTLEYAQTVSGWTRKGVAFTQAANERTAHASGTGVNPASGSVAWFGLIDLAAAAANNRRFLVISDGATSAFLDLQTTGVIRLVCAGVAATGSGNAVGAGVIPILFVYNKTGSSVKAYTSQEIISGTYNSGVVDGNKGFGGPNGTAAEMHALLGAAFAGADAEFSDTDARNLFTTIGYSVSW